MNTGFWWGDLREKDHLEDLCVGGRIILNENLRCERGPHNELIWLRIGTGGWHL